MTRDDQRQDPRPHDLAYARPHVRPGGRRNWSGFACYALGATLAAGLALLIGAAGVWALVLAATEGLPWNVVFAMMLLSVFAGLAWVGWQLAAHARDELVVLPPTPERQAEFLARLRGERRD